METITRYCLMRDDGEPYNVNDNTFVFTMGAVCAPDAHVHEIRLCECDEAEAELFGWRKTGDAKDNVSLIYPSLVQLDLAFGGSYEPAVESGCGEVVFLRVVESEYIGLARELG